MTALGVVATEGSGKHDIAVRELALKGLSHGVRRGRFEVLFQKARQQTLPRQVLRVLV